MSLHSSEWISSCQAGNNLGISAPCLITQCSAVGFYRSGPHTGTKCSLGLLFFFRTNINKNVQPFSQIGRGTTPSLAIQPLLLMVCHSQNICVFTEWERYWLCSLMLRVGGKTHGFQFLLQGKFNYHAKCVRLSRTNQQPPKRRSEPCHGGGNDEPMTLWAGNRTEPRLLCILVKQCKPLVLNKMGTQTPTFNQFHQPRRKKKPGSIQPTVWIVLREANCTLKQTAN